MEKQKLHNTIVEKSTDKVIKDEVIEMPNAFISLKGKRHYLKSKYRLIGFPEYLKEIEIDQTSSQI